MSLALLLQGCGGDAGGQAVQAESKGAPEAVAAAEVGGSAARAVGGAEEEAPKVDGEGAAEGAAKEGEVAGEEAVEVLETKAAREASEVSAKAAENHAAENAGAVSDVVAGSKVGDYVESVSDRLAAAVAKDSASACSPEHVDGLVDIVMSGLAKELAECLEDEASEPCQAYSNRFCGIPPFAPHAGQLFAGDDLAVLKMTPGQALQHCAALPSCAGFTYLGGREVRHAVQVYFKGGWNLGNSPAWTSYRPTTWYLNRSSASCWSPTDGRAFLGQSASAQACAELAAGDPQCGSLFEFDGAAGFCGCGVLGSGNADCAESAAKFHPKSALYSLTSLAPNLFSMHTYVEDVIRGHCNVFPGSLTGVVVRALTESSVVSTWRRRACGSKSWSSDEL